ncbi:MAG: hypothetical protein ACRCY4_02855 [Brevinema sp.]
MNNNLPSDENSKPEDTPSIYKRLIKKILWGSLRAYGLSFLLLALISLLVKLLSQK